MAPLLRRTWSRCGHTPILRQRTRAHQKISTIAALLVNPMRTRVQLCFRLHPNRNLTSAEVIAFLRCLLRHVSGNIVLIWDRFNPHRAAVTCAFLKKHPRLRMEFFPPYAPELNPTEYFWSYLKNNPLANLATLDLTSLIDKTRSSGRSIQRSSVLPRAFVRHSPLPLRLH